MIRLLLVELEPDDIQTRTLARALRDEGIEVIYTSAHTAAEIAITATQEDVKAVGLPVRADAHRHICTNLVATLATPPGADRIVVFATADDDEAGLRQSGVTAIFGAGAAEHIVAWAAKLA